jgi:hypothetical protein
MATETTKAQAEDRKAEDRKADERKAQERRPRDGEPAETEGAAADDVEAKRKANEGFGVANPKDPSINRYDVDWQGADPDNRDGLIADRTATEEDREGKQGIHNLSVEEFDEKHRERAERNREPGV